MTVAQLDLGYAFAPPAAVTVTVDDQHPVEDTLTLVITNRSGAAVQFQNPQGLTPQSDLPAWNDQASPLGRISVWFPWGDASGDLARAGDATRIVASSLVQAWAASPRMTDATLGVYWALFPLSKSVFLEQDASISFKFARIVSHVGAGGHLPEQTWMTALPRVPGYAADQSHTAVWKQELSAELTAPATAIPGEQLDLRWTSAGAEYCSLSPGGFDNLPTEGHQPVKMPAEPSVTYTLTAHPASGRPLSDARTVSAQTGWIDLGRCPAFVTIGGAHAYAVGSRLIALTSGPSGVWVSPDGRSWTRGADLTALEWPSGASDGSRLWVAGIESSQSGVAILAATTDGSTWDVRRDGPWAGVHYVSTAYFQDALWVFGGWRWVGRDDPSNADVWRSPDGGVSWSKAAPATWAAAGKVERGQAAVFAGRLWVLVRGRELWATATGSDWSRQQPAPFGSSTEVYSLAATSQGLYGLSMDSAANRRELWRMDRNQTWTSFPVPGALIDGGNQLDIAPFGNGVFVPASDGFRFVPPVAAKGSG